VLKYKSSSGKFAKIFFYLCVYLSCMPLWLLFVLATSNFWPYPALLPERMSLEFFASVLGDTNTLNAALTTVLLGILTVLLSLAIAIPAAKALAQRSFWGKGFVRMLVLVPIVVPGIALIIGIHISMIRLGLAGTLFGVAIMHTLFAVPYSIRILTNMYEILGEELEQQAKVLGASPFFIFLRVTLPRIMPGILAAGMLGFSISIAQYITTFIIGGGRVITITILMVPLIRGAETHFAAVYSVLLLATSFLSLALIEGIVRRYYNFKNVYQV